MIVWIAVGFMGYLHRAGVKQIYSIVKASATGKKPWRWKLWNMQWLDPTTFGVSRIGEKVKTQDIVLLTNYKHTLLHDWQYISHIQTLVCFIIEAPTKTLHVLRRYLTVFWSTQPICPISACNYMNWYLLCNNNGDMYNENGEMMIMTVFDWLKWQWLE